MNIKKSIAFFGPPASGKTTMAKFMADFYGGDALSFADPIRDAYSRLHDVPLSELTTVPNKYQYRKGLQEYGDAARAVNPDIWVNKLTAEIGRRYGFGHRIFFVDDVRRPNEFDALKELGFIMVKVEGDPNAPDKVLPGDTGEHDSEQHWPTFEYDHVIPWVEPLALNGYSQKRAIYDRLAMIYMILDKETVVWNREHSKQRRTSSSTSQGARRYSGRKKITRAQVG